MKVQFLGMKLSVVLFALLTHSTFAKVPTIKVLIGKNLKSIKVSGLDIQKKINGSTRVKLYRGKKILRFNCHVLKKIKKIEKPLMLSSLWSSTGLIRWEKMAYQGQLNLLASSNQKGCDLINEISLEDYLESLLAKEMNASWPLEALKAQAVAARSYAYHKIVTQQVSKTIGFKTHYDIENSEKHQVNGSFFDTTKNTEKAAKQTVGEVLKLSTGKLTPIFFHAKCGGKTLTPSQVWTNKVDGYKSVNCPYCHKIGKKPWVLTLPRSKFKKVVDKTLKTFYQDSLKNMKKSQMRIVPDHKGKSTLRIYDNDRLLVVQKSRIRSSLSRGKAPSNNFYLENQGKKITLKGKGHGHGVGMCQLGAFEMARRGFDYKQILAHYFPKHKIEKIY